MWSPPTRWTKRSQASSSDDSDDDDDEDNQASETSDAGLLAEEARLTAAAEEAVEEAEDLGEESMEGSEALTTKMRT